MIVEAIHNAALLSLTAVGLYFFLRFDVHANRVASTMTLGLSCGLVAFLVTISPLELADGATIDTRAGPVIIAGIFGGPYAAFAAAALGAIARWSVGGSFAVTGTIVFCLYAAVGTLLWRRFHKSSLGAGLGLVRLMSAAGLSVVAAGLMFFLIQPRQVAFDWLAADFPLIAAANTVSVMLCGLIGRLVLTAASQRTELAQTIETLELAKNSGGIGIWTFDLLKGRVNWDVINRDLHGIELEGASGSYRDWARTVHPEDLPRVEREFENALAGTKPFDTVYRVVLPDNSIRDLKGNAIVLRNSANEPIRVVGANYDLTEVLQKDRELEEARLVAAQAQKMEAIGRLTGGVAHDFNNLLAIILGNLELLNDDKDEPTMSSRERKKTISSAISAAERGGELTKSMLAFAKQAPLEPRKLQINDVVIETQSWLTRTIPETIKIDTNLQSNPWPLSLDHAGLQSVLVNVIVNATESMPTGGTLKIETRNVFLEEDDRPLGHVPDFAGKCVMLSVSDTGEGIEPEFLPLIFEPFTSTKETGLGSGLGLSMVKGFVDQSGGFVRVNSDVGIGTTVELFFPASGVPALESKADPSPIEEVTLEGRGAHILVAEDQPEVLSVVARTLELAGYQVDAARDGDEALKKFSEHPVHDLLLTDVVMPGTLLGPGLAKACRQIKPELPVIFMTGYASAQTVQRSGLNESDTLLMKPVKRSDLLEAIERQLRITSRNSKGLPHSANFDQHPAGRN